eukprot:10895-Heterococcus_DN1.PRE.1
MHTTNHSESCEACHAVAAPDHSGNRQFCTWDATEEACVAAEADATTGLPELFACPTAAGAAAAAPNSNNNTVDS